MRVLFICNTLKGGGAEKLINDLTPILRDREKIECEVLILTDKDQKYIDSLTANGIKVEVLPEDYTGHFKRMSYIRKYIKAGAFDIVHANLFPVIYYCAFLKRFHRRSMPVMIMTEHNTDNKRRHIDALRPVERYIYYSYDHIISISPATETALKEWLRPSAKWDKRFSVVNNGVPLEDFYNAVPYEKSELSEKIKNSDKVLCMVGSFTEQKNHKTMIDMMKKLPTEYKLVLVGEGELFNDIKALVSDNGLDERMILLGFRKDVNRIMKSSDIIIIPSKWEGFGLVAVEAMACSKAVVVSDVPGLADVVGDAAIKVGWDKADEYVNAVLSFEDKKLYKKYQARAVVRAQNYDIKKMAKDYAKIYKGII